MYASLTPKQQGMARNIFLRLTELGEGTEDTRRRVALAELLPEGERGTTVFDLLDLLARRRLVTLNRETTHAHAEVAHEALIREWPALRLAGRKPGRAAPPAANYGSSASVAGQPRGC
ncbi:MAG: hypothetical protein IPK53_11445 [bacterium]|nr:hypothetical protein [bacterium]